jgi:transposase
MRTIGIDLAVTAAHKAVVMAENGRFVTPVLSFYSRWEEIADLVTQAREGVEADHPLRAVMEPTGMAWLTVAVSLSRLGVTPYLVNGRRVKDLRRYYKRHASSDRISARVLAKLPLVDEESLYPLILPTPTQLACQRGCKQDNHLQTMITATKNRLRDCDRWAWPGLGKKVFRDLYSPAARRFREEWYDPAAVVAAGVEGVGQALADVANEKELGRLEILAEVAVEALKLYGLGAIDYARLQEEMCREQRLLAHLEREQDALNQETVEPLYLELHPSCHLETLKGVGPKGAAVYASFIGLPDRFPDTSHFRGWHGLVPDSRQSGHAESKGLRISRAGPGMIKKYAYLNADVARRHDPQIAAIYYDQMVKKGNHHNQAVCACATRLLDRVLVVLREDRPYELRNVDGTPVTAEEARTIIAEHYKVPEKVRKRNTRRARKKRLEERMEHQQQKGSRPRR